jgi:RNA polymerase sigma-70 factor (ECF subfamily)
MSPDPSALAPPPAPSPPGAEASRRARAGAAGDGHGLTDEVLVARVVAGERSEFGVLVERHEGVVRRVVARIVPPSAVEDVVQDAFLRAYHRLPGFRGEAPFRSWLLRIAHNAALDALARARHRPVAADDDGLEEGVPVTATAAPRTPAESLEAGERRDRLAAKVRLLPPRHRAVLVLRDVEGLTYEEIALVTETPLGSVKGRLHRARRELIELLRANTYDWELPE